MAEQMRSATDDTLRVLVVGAGMAGLTVAQLLRRDGMHPVLIDSAAPDTHAGYMLALMPLVDSVIDDLGVRQTYLDRSTPFDRYGFRSHTGKPLREDSLEGILDRYGDYRGISREDLIETLAVGGSRVSFNTTVSSMSDTATGTTVTLSEDGVPTDAEFDLVIIADGIHSTTRELVLNKGSVDVLDTKWGGWVSWIPSDNSNLGEELWGAGFFVGIYPVAGKLGVFVGGPRADTAVGPERFAAGVRAKLRSRDHRIDDALDAVVNDEDAYFWPLTDCRASRWATGRTILLGDAAAGFLPTAGIGACMAMESAWVLARMLRHARPDNVRELLQAYEEAQRPRVEDAQGNSRRLAGLMFRRSRILGSIRDLAFRVVSVKAALKPIQQLLATKPDPDRLARERVAAGRE